MKEGYYDGAALFRALENFIVQFGIAKKKEQRDKWAGNPIKDDPQLKDENGKPREFKRGYNVCLCMCVCAIPIVCIAHIRTFPRCKQANNQKTKTKKYEKKK